MTTWVLFAGLPGSGKSTLARALAGRLDAAILGKDQVRAVLFPGPLTDYSEQQDQVCVRALLEAAAYLTARQRVAWVFFDGRTFSTARQRDEVLLAAGEAGARWRILHVECAEAVAEARLRQIDPDHPAKNRSPELYRAIRERFEGYQQPTLTVDTTNGFAGQMEAIVAYLHSA